ncbi:MAG: GNAT family N-acetyltransferase [Microbacterium sp.]|nr:GNAT family N-acetyltransferase [Microbacterium sp.]
MVRMRDAGPGDGPFLTDMLVEAVNWNRALRRPRVEVLADSRVRGYIAGWPRPGDVGAIAEDDDGEAIGAGWLRLFRADAPGYGFVASGVPELTVGVRAPWRAQGVGRALVRRLLVQARAAGHARVSLSVERGNFAKRLYASEGFATVASDDHADTMVRILQ